jgi:hypothetical protein
MVFRSGRFSSAMLIALVALAAGCADKTTNRAATATPPPVPAPWPRAADYTTIKSAIAARNDALFRWRDWRKRSFAATLAAQTLLTVRIAPGTCAAYVTELYGSLRDLMEAYPGEDWRPLVRLVRRQPALATVCRPPVTTPAGV